LFFSPGNDVKDGKEDQVEDDAEEETDESQGEFQSTVYDGRRIAYVI